MAHKIFISILIFTTLTCFTWAQQETYTVTKAPFSSDKYDEYSPVFYKNGIIFSSNRGSGSFVDYSSSGGKATFDIYFIDTTKKVTWRKTRLFSKSLKTPLNDGPVTFNSTMDAIYFTRNLRVDGNLKDLSYQGNKLGIFSAVSEGDKWTKISEFRFNTEYYNITTPCLSPDGSKLFFSSDRPGGFGGSDIYYCNWKEGYWEDPVNLGPAINTKGNESYPFMNEGGELYFSSDGHSGLGGKDIFVTKQKAGGWYQPVRLDEPVNSKFDDFGIVTDPLTDEGYFSSNRGKTFDIYHFKSTFFQFLLSDPQTESQHCLTISDTSSIQVDTLRFQYVWDFGDGSKSYGTIAGHCFPGSGNYNINLDIIDRRTGKLFFRKLTYDIEIFNIDQPFINCPDVALAGEMIELDGLYSNCPGYTITGYSWDFGDGIKESGEKVSHKFTNAGEFDVRMGLTLKNSTGTFIKRIVSKKILVFQGEQEKSSFLAESLIKRQGFRDIGQIENIKVKSYYSAEKDLNKDAIFQVIIYSSRNKVALTNNIFKKVPEKYSISEVFNSEAGQYYYIVDQQMSLMAAYPAYSEMIASGYNDAKVMTRMLNETAEKELYLIKKNYILLADTHFDITNRLTTNAYIMLDQVVQLMTKYPLIKLEVGVHTDNQGIPSNNQMLSEMRAQIIANYLINRGISSKRITATGFGSSRPVAANTYPAERRLNRRIDFTIVK
jgi:outer membrane protein OmpA-like peptidoglycan-associated protein